MDAKLGKTLEKVRKLLAQADGTPYPEEAATFRARAEELMTSYAIEAWQLQALDEREKRGGMPEKRDFDFSWFRSSPYRDAIESMFKDVARHCRCVPVRQKAEWRDYKPVTIPVIGLPSDLDYLDMLFTSLLLQLIAKIDPQPSQQLTLQENVAMLRESGMGWREMAMTLLDEDLLDEQRFGRPDPNEDQRFPFRQRHRRRQPDWYSRTGKRLQGLYRSYCKQKGVPPNYVDPRRYRKSFADGFQLEIWSRLHRIREAREGGKGSSTALALRDIYEANRQALFDFFPDLRPHERDCICSECAERRLRAAERELNRKPTKELRPWERERDRTDWAASGLGREAGKQAEIMSGAPQVRSRGEIGSGS